MSDNSSDDGEVAPPGGAEGGYVTAGAYKAALDESALLRNENNWLKRRIIELEKADVVDGRRGRNTTRMKKNEMVQLDYRNKGKVKTFVKLRHPAEQRAATSLPAHTRRLLMKACC